jgi:polysaccharide lyase-like protein
MKIKLSSNRRPALQAGLLTVLFMVTQSTPASAAILANITGESGSVQRTQYAGAANGLLHDGGKSYDILEQQPAGYSVPAFPDVNTRHRPLEQMRHHIAYAGERSILFQGYDIPDEDCFPPVCPSDRQEVRLVGPYSSQAMRFDQWRYLRFYVKVHPSTTIGSQRAIVSQTWQLGSTRTSTRDPLGPAFAIMMSNVDAGRVRMEFTYRNNPVPGNTNKAITFASSIINKDQWYSFHVQMKAKYEGARGAILVWKNNANLVLEEALNYSATDDSSWKFHWGYPPEPDVEGGLRDAFDVRVGMYRPAPMDYLTFWMDNIRLTDTASSLSGN